MYTVTRHVATAECAYLAGVIDGEGCLTISRRMARGGVNYSYRPELIIANTGLDWLHGLCRIWGGAVHVTRKPSGNVRAAYALRMAAQDTYTALTLALPHIRLKRYEAELLLSFYDTYADKTDVRFTAREEIYSELVCRRKTHV